MKAIEFTSNLTFKSGVISQVTWPLTVLCTSTQKTDEISWWTKYHGSYDSVKRSSESCYGSQPTMTYGSQPTMTFPIRFLSCVALPVQSALCDKVDEQVQRNIVCLF